MDELHTPTISHSVSDEEKSNAKRPTTGRDRHFPTMRKHPDSLCRLAVRSTMLVKNQAPSPLLQIFASDLALRISEPLYQQ